MEAELKRLSGEKLESEEAQNQATTAPNPSTLVTSDGTYATQSAFNITA